MDSFEWNKIIGAVLGSVLFILVIKVAAEVIYEPEKPAKPGYVVEGVVEETAGGGAAAPVEETMPDWGTVLPAADVANGKTISAKCEQCHDTSSAKTNKIGPALYGVVGRARASGRGLRLFRRDDERSRAAAGPLTSLFKYHQVAPRLSSPAPR